MKPPSFHFASAFTPLHAFRASASRHDWQQAFGSAHRDRLLYALGSAIASVAKASGMTPQAISNLLPLDCCYATIEATLVPYANAQEVWHQHNGGLVGIIRGAGMLLAEVSYGLGEFAGAILADVNNSLEGSRMREPIGVLITSLDGYWAALCHCASILESDPLVLEGMQRQRRKRIANGALVAGALAGLGIGVEPWAAQQLAASSASSPAPVATAAGESTATAPPVSAAVRPAPTLAVANAKVGRSTAARPTAAPSAISQPGLATASPERATVGAAAPAIAKARSSCLNSCVARCSDDAICERGCARECPTR